MSAQSPTVDETKEPPCEACGRPSCAAGNRLRSSSFMMQDGIAAYLCAVCWKDHDAPKKIAALRSQPAPIPPTKLCEGCVAAMAAAQIQADRIGVNYTVICMECRTHHRRDASTVPPTESEGPKVGERWEIVDGDGWPWRRPDVLVSLGSDGWWTTEGGGRVRPPGDPVGGNHLVRRLPAPPAPEATSGRHCDGCMDPAVAGGTLCRAHVAAMGKAKTPDPYDGRGQPGKDAEIAAVMAGRGTGVELPRRPNAHDLRVEQHKAAHLADFDRPLPKREPHDWDVDDAPESRVT